MLKYFDIIFSYNEIFSIFQGRDATPYLERNRVGRDAIDAASALTDMGKYLFLERRLPVYDIAVAITKLDMCRYNGSDVIMVMLIAGTCLKYNQLHGAIIEQTNMFSIKQSSAGTQLGFIIKREGGS